MMALTFFANFTATKDEKYFTSKKLLDVTKLETLTLNQQMELGGHTLITLAHKGMVLSWSKIDVLT